MPIARSQQRHNARGKLAIQPPRRFREPHRAGVRAFHRVDKQRPRTADKADQALAGRQHRSRRGDRFGLESQAARRLRRLSGSRRCVPSVSWAVEFRRAVVVGQCHAERAQREQQIAEQNRGVEVEVADRSHRHFGGELGNAAQLLEAVRTPQFLIRAMIAAGLAHQPDGRNALRLARPARARNGLVTSSWLPIDTQFL